MLRLYFKQTLQMIKQNRLFSALYIMGTALPLICTTIFFVSVYVTVAPMYPESRRATTAYIYDCAIRQGTSWMGNSLSLEALNQYFYNVKNAEIVSAQRSSWGGAKVQLPDGKLEAIGFKPTDPQFFKVYTFDFVEGTPFTQADFEAGARKVVISQPLAQRLFGDESAIGKNISVNFADYRVTGVVKPGAPIHEMSHADAYVPYTSIPDYKADTEREDMLGPYKAVFVSNDLDALRDEVAEIVRRYNSADTTKVWIVNNQPISHADRALSGNRSTVASSSTTQTFLQFLPIILALLLVPALNLSGMISGRMETRSRELAIRKAFGAQRGNLLSQVMWENFFMTLAGGIIGLVITWIVIATCSRWLWLQVFQISSQTSIEQSTITSDMLFSPAVFGIVLVLCLLLNLFSALIPAWNSLRHPIVDSMK